MSKGTYRRIKDTNAISICYASEENIGKYRCNHTNEPVSKDEIKIHKNLSDYKHHQNEISIAKSFKPGEKIAIHGREKIIMDSGIPIGFPKTDVVIKVKDVKTGVITLIPISVKLPNAKYAHNHLTDQMAQEVLGKKYDKIMRSMMRTNDDKLNDIQAKVKTNKYNKDKTYLSVPIGYEIQVSLNTNKNQISEEIHDIDTKVAFLSSATGKKDVDVDWVYSREITNEKKMGVAKHILVADSTEQSYSAQDYIDKMQTVRQYAKHNPVYIEFRRRNMDIYDSKIHLPEEKKKNLVKINSRLYFYIRDVYTISDIAFDKEKNKFINLPKNKLSNTTSDIIENYKGVMFSDIKANATKEK